MQLIEQKTQMEFVLAPDSEQTDVRDMIPGVAEYIAQAVTEYPEVAQVLIWHIRDVAEYYPFGLDLHLQVYGGSLLRWAVARLNGQLALTPAAQYHELASEQRTLQSYLSQDE